MACTRSKNLPNNYCLEQRAIKKTARYDLYKNSAYGDAFEPAMPTFGVTPSHMPWNTLSTNPVDIETSLFGIGSCNLVEPTKPVIPDLHGINEISYYSRVPFIHAPEFKPYLDQRPFPIPE